MTPDEIATLEANTISICAEHERENWRKNNHRRSCALVGTPYFVKYGDPKTLWPEIETQRYIFEYAKSQPDTPRTPRIPQVIHSFRDERTMYLVMEFITLTAIPPSDFIERIAVALKWLSEVPSPFGHVIGPLGGGRIRHQFFKEDEAPLSFTSVEALERYIEKGRKRLWKGIQPNVQPVSISGERLIFTQPDLDASNFGIDEQGNTVLLDFGEIALLPESFATYARFPDDKFAAVAKSWGWASSNRASMAKISANLWMTSDPTLGLNENGVPMTVQQNLDIGDRLRRMSLESRSPR